MYVEKVLYFVIPSEARNLSSVCTQEKKERFLALLGMTKVWHFFRSLLDRARRQSSVIRQEELPWEN